MNKVAVVEWSKLADRMPAYALVANVDLVVVRYGDEVSVLFGRCLHRGGLLADGFVDGDNLICGLHNWDYRIQTGISEYNNHEALRKFSAWIEDGELLVDADEIAAWERDNPQPYKRDDYQGLYADEHGDPVEPHVQLIQKYATEGLSKTGHHGVVEAMGVPRQELPSWDDIQILTAQLATPPQLDDAEVGTEVIVGPNAQKPLRLEIPLLVSDMSFGSLSEPAKVALAKGAELAGTGIASGEGGMLADDQAAFGGVCRGLPGLPEVIKTLMAPKFSSLPTPVKPLYATQPHAMPWRGLQRGSGKREDEAHEDPHAEREANRQAD